ncbi:MAG: hypothetical protein WDN04_13670 [Rhodospirillales bacterium]
MQLRRGGIGPEAELQKADLARAEARRPEQLAGLLARIAVPAVGVVRFELGRQAQHLPAFDHALEFRFLVLLQHVTDQVELGDPLRDDQLAAGARIVQPGGHALVPPFERVLALGD